MQINIGSVLHGRAGGYLLRRMLAPGVWLADAPCGGAVALKLAPPPAFPPAGLLHPRIVAVLDVAAAGSVPCFVMEYVGGPALPALLGAGPLPPARSVAWIAQLLEGLACAHAQGVVHRDVKPSNLLIDAGGSLKLSDFGLASRPGLASAHGTPGYMAPEQMRGQADCRSDLFAATVVLYQMLAGRRPYQGTPFQLMQQVLLEPPPPLPPPLAAFEPLIARGLAKTPSGRYQHASEFRDALLATTYA
ncbi:hypothetical protein ASC94_00600 [Massilia sp. Root418]|uniref:serine/threonine-protein kinase n=1 Tax=Massilia sp. Root418 TaxID=1736532 RepID=UPI0006F4BCAA|nr:serine/threonine-protein kinase [Massilia sp. Root418]KQX01185.1 hypothetical protein ASC94_00600 [Massilia sp. Root418]